MSKLLTKKKFLLMMKILMKNIPMKGILMKKALIKKIKKRQKYRLIDCFINKNTLLHNFFVLNKNINAFLNAADMDNKKNFKNNFFLKIFGSSNVTGFITSHN